MSPKNKNSCGICPGKIVVPRNDGGTTTRVGILEGWFLIPKGDSVDDWVRGAEKGIIVPRNNRGTIMSRKDADGSIFRVWASGEPEGTN